MAIIIILPNAVALLIFILSIFALAYIWYFGRHPRHFIMPMDKLVDEVILSVIYIEDIDMTSPVSDNAIKIFLCVKFHIHHDEIFLLAVNTAINTALANNRLYLVSGTGARGTVTARPPVPHAQALPPAAVPIFEVGPED